MTRIVGGAAAGAVGAWILLSAGTWAQSAGVELPCAECESATISPSAPLPVAAAQAQSPPGGFLARLLDTSDFPARWNCGTWTAGHGWLHIISDLAIWGAYMSIPLALLYFVRRRQDVPFTGLFWLFMAFIAACGTGHLIEAGIFYWPVYRLSGVVKAFTAIVSWATVLALIPIIPRALAMPGLAKINEQLTREVAERSEAERLAKLRAHELEEAYKVFLGREQRIIELKRQVNELSRRAGLPEPHELDLPAAAAQARPAPR